uniref:RNase H type-1 domain-containing protein n=1 Tax=Davidia involucrata TaxID=16924 RepID=A0A5B7B6Y3_DAVIN
MAILFGIEFVKEIGILDLVVEGACLSVVSAIANVEDDFSDLGHIVYEIKQCMRGFRSCVCRHVNRDANGVAHALAGYARDISSDIFWLEELPVCFQGTLARDLPV